jgi:hypothetical protein
VIRPGWAVLSGLTGGIAFLVVIWDAIMGGIFGASFLRVLGGTLVHRASRGVTYAVGLATHFLLSAAFGLAYALFIEWIDPSSFAEGAASGLLVGLAHGAVATVLLAWALPHIHALGPTGPDDARRSSAFHGRDLDRRARGVRRHGRSGVYRRHALTASPQPTWIAIVCQPVAPSGNGSARASVCTSPSASVARTCSRCSPAPTGTPSFH